MLAAIFRPRMVQAAPASRRSSPRSTISGKPPRGKIDPAANELFEALQTIEQAQTKSTAVPVAPAIWLDQARKGLLGRIDPVNGGFGDPTSGQKFPQAPALALLRAATTRDSAAGAALTRALDAMAEGGIHDQLGGGFHRYATEPTWSVPHFEKMLYDNAQLLRLMPRAKSRTTKRSRATSPPISSATCRHLEEAFIQRRMPRRTAPKARPISGRTRPSRMHSARQRPPALRRLRTDGRS